MTAAPHFTLFDYRGHRLLLETTTPDGDGIVKLKVSTTSAESDGVEALLATLNTYTDGIETLLTALNTYVDGLETLVTSTNTKSDTLHADLASILAKIIVAPATEAKQDTGNTSLASILAKIIAAPATEAKQDTGNTSLAAILAKIIAAPSTAANQASILAALLGPRPFVLKGTINNGQTTYTFGTTPINVGGLITIATGLPAGTILTSLTLRIKVLTTNFASGNQGTCMFFDANPSASTFTDNTAISLHANDFAKCIVNGNAAAAAGGHIGSMYLWTFTFPRVVVDGSGNVYFAFNAGGTLVWNSTNATAWEADGTY